MPSPTLDSLHRSSLRLCHLALCLPLSIPQLQHIPAITACLRLTIATDPHMGISLPLAATVVVLAGQEDQTNQPLINTDAIHVMLTAALCRPLGAPPMPAALLPATVLLTALIASLEADLLCLVCPFLALESLATERGASSALSSMLRLSYKLSRELSAPFARVSSA